MIDRELLEASFGGVDAGKGRTRIVGLELNDVSQLLSLGGPGFVRPRSAEVLKERTDLGFDLNSWVRISNFWYINRVSTRSFSRFLLSAREQTSTYI